MEVTAKEWRISFGGDKDILNVMVAQLCNLLKKYLIIHCKQVDCMAHELHLGLAAGRNSNVCLCNNKAAMSPTPSQGRSWLGVIIQGIVVSMFHVFFTSVITKLDFMLKY